MVLLEHIRWRTAARLAALGLGALGVTVAFGAAAQSSGPPELAPDIGLLPTERAPAPVAPRFHTRAPVSPPAANARLARLAEDPDPAREGRRRGRRDHPQQTTERPPAPKAAVPVPARPPPARTVPPAPAAAAAPAPAPAPGSTPTHTDEFSFER